MESVQGLVEAVNCQIFLFHFNTVLMEPPADTRTDQHNSLGLALLQHQHIGILPTNHEDPDDTDSAQPLLPQASIGMPSPWVRGAMVVRTNSLIRGHSGVRWSLVESLVKMLKAGVVPVSI